MNKVENPDRSTWEGLLKRPTQTYEQIEGTVLEIFDAIKAEGDIAVKRYTEKFDGSAQDELQVSPQELEEAGAVLNSELKEAIALAKKNIEAFHEAQKTARVEVITAPGVRCWQEKRPIQKVGLYIFRWLNFVHFLI